MGEEETMRAREVEEKTGAVGALTGELELADHRLEAAAVRVEGGQLGWCISEKKQARGRASYCGPDLGFTDWPETWVQNRPQNKNGPKAQQKDKLK